MSLEGVAASTSADLAAHQTRTKIAYQLAAKQLDVYREQSDAVLQLIEAANVNGKSIGAGGSFDASA